MYRCRHRLFCPGWGEDTNKLSSRSTGPPTNQFEAKRMPKLGAVELRFGVLNVLVFAIGFLSNLSGGFQKSWAFPIAKEPMEPPAFRIGSRARMACLRVAVVFLAESWWAGF